MLGYLSDNGNIFFCFMVTTHTIKLIHCKPCNQSLSIVQLLYFSQIYLTKVQLTISFLFKVHLKICCKNLEITEPFLSNFIHIFFEIQKEVNSLYKNIYYKYWKMQTEKNRLLLWYSQAGTETVDSHGQSYANSQFSSIAESHFGIADILA